MVEEAAQNDMSCDHFLKAFSRLVCLISESIKDKVAEVVKVAAAKWDAAQSTPLKKRRRALGKSGQENAAVVVANIIGQAWCLRG